MSNLTSNATSSQSLARTVADILGIGELPALAFEDFQLFCSSTFTFVVLMLSALRFRAGPVCICGPKLWLPFTSANQHQDGHVHAVRPANSTLQPHDQ